ncbi:MAG: sulfite exporter TauE/SafE family protein [Pseudomonadota bacterium]
MPDWLLQWLPLIAAMLATGLVAGVLAGLFGIGGGVVIVPVLETALGVLGVDPAIRMHVAVATSLATIVPTSISSSLAHHRRHSLDLGIAKRWAPFMLVGAVLGALLAAQLHSRVLALIFAAIALLIAVKMLFFPVVQSVTRELPRTFWLPAIPTSIGAFSAMMGIGGGVMSVTALSLFGQSIHRAVGTGALLGLAIALPGTLGFIVTGLADTRVPSGNLGYVSLIGFACIAPMTVLTAPLGARIAHAFSEKKLTLIFGVFLVFVSARLVLRALG